MELSDAGSAILSSEKIPDFP